MNVFDRLNVVAVTLPGNMPLRFALEKKAEVNISRETERKNNIQTWELFSLLEGDKSQSAISTP